MLHHLLFHYPPSHPERTILDFILAVGWSGRSLATIRARLDPTQIPNTPEVVLASHGIRVIEGHLYIGLGPGLSVKLLREDGPPLDPRFTRFVSVTPHSEIVREMMCYGGRNHSRSLRIPLSALPAPGAEYAPPLRNGKSVKALAWYLSRRVGSKGETLLDLAFSVAPMELDGRKIAARRRRGELPKTPPLPEEILWKYRLRVCENRLRIVMAAAEIRGMIRCEPSDIILGIKGSFCVPEISSMPGHRRPASSRLEIPLESLESWRLGGER